MPIHMRDEENWKEHKMKKVVTEPDHYASGKIEVLEMLTQQFGLPYVLGQICKYSMRAGKKDDELQDIQKALFYAKWAVEVKTAEIEKRPTCKPKDLFP